MTLASIFNVNYIHYYFIEPFSLYTSPKILLSPPQVPPTVRTSSILIAEISMGIVKTKDLYTL